MTNDIHLRATRKMPGRPEKNHKKTSPWIVNNLAEFQTSASPKYKPTVYIITARPTCLVGLVYIYYSHFV
jgi:hypothetical protein